MNQFKYFIAIMTAVFSFISFSVHALEMPISFTLVDADSDLDIGALNEDVDVIESLLAPTLNMRANVNINGHKSVVFYLNDSKAHTDNNEPYAYAGDRNGDYRAWKLKDGIKTITAKIYSGTRGRGDLLGEYSVTFSYTNELTNNNSFIADINSLQNSANSNKFAIISQNMDLGGGTLPLAQNITLIPDGGIINNGTLENVSRIFSWYDDQFLSTDVLFSTPFTSLFKPEWYGALGNGVNNDSPAFIQSLEYAEFVNLKSTGTYNLTDRIRIFRAGDLKIVGNNATILSINSPDFDTFVFGASLNKVTINNLNFDGQNQKGRAFEFRTNFEVNNVDVINLFNDETSVYAFRVDVYNQLTHASFNNTSCDNIDAGENGIIGDGDGASRCFMIHWRNTDGTTIISINGGTFTNVWGDDGDVVQIAQANDVYDHSSKVVISNTTMGHASRRLIKAFATGIELINNTFISADITNPKVQTTVSSGMIAIAVNSPQENLMINNIRVTGNLFDNTGGYDGRIIVQDAENVILESNVFLSSDVYIKNDIGDLTIENNEFHINSAIYNYANMYGALTIRNNDAYYNYIPPVAVLLDTFLLDTALLDTTPPDTLDFRGWIHLRGTDKSFDNISILNNRLTINSEDWDNVLGMIFAYNDGNSAVTNMELDGNTISRIGTKERNSIFWFNFDLDNTTTISNNTMHSPTYSTTGLVLQDQDPVSEPIVVNNIHMPTELEYPYPY